MSRDWRTRVRRVGVGWCGCQRPTHHEDGCLYGLDPDHQVVRSAELAFEPFPAPRLAPDAECAFLGRIRDDLDFAIRVRDRISGVAA